MKNNLLSLCRLAACAAAAALLLTACGGPGVTLTEDAETYTLDNGIVTARVSKVSGDLVSFRYEGREMFATRLEPDFHPEAQDPSTPDNPNWKDPQITGRAHGYWSHDAMGVRGSAPAIPSVTINPRRNGGRIAEVSVKAISEGRKMGTGPGTNAAAGDLQVDIEIRYTLEKGASGVYTYCIFTHPESYALAQFGEARYCAKLAPCFDWMSVDKDVDFHYPKDHNAGDKYVYTANQSENPAFGWSSTTENIGLFYINPSMEYMSGGPTKVEFLGHRDTNIEAAGCVLNYWRSSHYGGAEANIAAGEAWNKVVGPFLIYANKGEGHDAIYADARRQAAAEAAKWPYKWVKGVDYPLAGDRAEVKGRFALNDPLAPAEFRNLHVGLVHAPYVSPRPNPVPEVITNWQRDAKFYQFWTVGAADGTFSIPNVRPGTYTLSAFTDGVLGEFARADITVEAGRPLDLGTLEWTPVRKGKQVFEIGVPNRNASEFFKADARRDPRIALEYAELFPDDVHFVVGKSDFARDWFFIHVPHNEDPDAQVLPFFGIRSVGRATPFRITFDLAKQPAGGEAILRAALCGTSARALQVSVNGRDAGPFVLPQTGDGVIVRHGSQGIWYETEFRFDAALLHAGTNTLTLTVPEGPVNNGVMYDYLRLEL